MIFFKSSFDIDLKYEHLDENFCDSSFLKKLVSTKLHYNNFSLYLNGHKLKDDELVPDDSTIYILFALPGGKGGFGSMLRAIGAQIEKTTNREACRDLSGRRLRDINEEQRLKKWISKEAEREAEKAKRRKEKLERLVSRPKHNFVDFEYEKEISELPERIDDALNKGLQKASILPTEKRKSTTTGTSSKKLKVWLADDLSSDSESDKEQQRFECSSLDDSNQESNKFISFDKPCCSTTNDNSLNSDCHILNSEQFTTKIESTRNYESPCSSKESSTDFDAQIQREYFNKGQIISELVENSKIYDKFASSSGENSTSNETDKHIKKESNFDKCQVMSSNENSINSNVQIQNEINFNKSCASTSNDDCDIQKTVELTKNQSKIDFTNLFSETKTCNKDPVPESIILEDLQENCEVKIVSNENQIKSISTMKEDSSSIPDKVNQNEVESDIDLLAFNSSSELELLGLERLKFALMARGLKCGGTIKDRSERLWKVRNLRPDEYPPNLLAKGKK